MFLRKKVQIPSVINKKKIKNSFLIFCLTNLIWFIFRTGTKPSRIVYPCQRAAVTNISVSLGTTVPLSISASFLTTVENIITKNRVIFLAILLFGVVSGGVFLKTQDVSQSQEVQLNLEAKSATVFPASDVYVVNGRKAAHITTLIDLMASNDFFFYQSSNIGEKQGPDGLIAYDDVVLLKINSQWPSRGGTNTDVLKEVIQAIIEHPDGFIGEIVVADSGQGRGNMDFPYGNAENDTQSTQDVVKMFSSMCQVSTYNWQDIRSNAVEEYSEGDMTDGYIVYDTADPETGIFVSYPKFMTEFQTNISFRYGIWNGTGYEKRLKVINMPILKSHSNYGVTASIKNYMGVQTELLNGGLANGHVTVATGGMGTLMVECGLPTLNIIDAIWVNANPYPSLFTGPSTRYRDATRINILMAGVDPVALDYWAAKHVLIETALSTGHNSAQTMDPENNERFGLIEAFGVWLNLSKNEIVRAGYNVTSDENCMNVFVFEDHTPISTSSPFSTSFSSFIPSSSSSTFSSSLVPSSTVSTNSSGRTTSQLPTGLTSASSTTPSPGFSFTCLILSLSAILLLLRKRKKNDGS